MASWKCLQMRRSVSLHCGSKSDVCVQKKLMKEMIDSLEVQEIICETGGTCIQAVLVSAEESGEALSVQPVLEKTTFLIS